MNPKESLISPNGIYVLFYDVDVALDITLEVELLDMDSEDNLKPVSQ